MIHGFNKRFHNFFKLPLLLGTQKVLSLQSSQPGVFPNIISLRSSHRDILIVFIGFKILSDVTLIGKFGFLILYFHGQENFTSKVFLSGEYLVLNFANMFLTGCQKLSPVVSYKNRPSLKNRKIYKKTPVPESFLIKLRGPATLLDKRLWHKCFPVHFAKFLRTPFLIEHLWWLLLNDHDQNVSYN